MSESTTQPTTETEAKRLPLTSVVRRGLRLLAGAVNDFDGDVKAVELEPKQAKEVERAVDWIKSLGE